MSNPRALVVRTAGINTDRETTRALELAGAEVELLHLERLIENPGHLSSFSIVVFPGGFSYGDDVAAGRVFALKLRHDLEGPLRALVARGGLVIGICNGFQVLVQTGLFEGPSGPKQGRPERTIALHANETGRFESHWVTVEVQDSACPWLEPGTRIPMVAAHAEGRFVVRDDDALEGLRVAGQLALRYVDPEDSADGPPGYPACPNGSVEAIAGICDVSGRVLGLMPHPERNVSPFHHPLWRRMADREERTEGEGLLFFRSLVDAART